MQTPSLPGRPASSLVRAADWYAALVPAESTAPRGRIIDLDIRRFAGTPPQIEQPALSDTVLCLHLGGAKEVRRHHDGRTEIHDVPLGALTLMPAGEANRWETRGPVEYAHIAVGAPLLARIAREEFGCDPAGLRLRSAVGFRDPLMEQLFAGLLRMAESGETHSRLYRDSLLVVLLTTLLERQGEWRRSPSAAALKGGLAAWKLKRITDYLNTHLADEVELPDLSAIAGLSRAQFFRAFRQSTATTPHRYLTGLRLDRARDLLGCPDADWNAVAQAVGLGSADRLRRLLARRARGTDSSVAARR